MDQGPGTKRDITDSLRRLLDQRGEERSEAVSATAVLTHDGNRHVIGVVNLSASGAMVRFRGDLVEGDAVQLQLLDHGTVKGQVRWIRDGHVGIVFETPIEGTDGK